jgi:hypothetical protein
MRTLIDVLVVMIGVGGIAISLWCVSDATHANTMLYFYGRIVVGTFSAIVGASGLLTLVTERAQ